MSRFDAGLLARALAMVGAPSAPEPVSGKSFIDQAVAIIIRLCKHFEGLHLKPYLCPAGVPTIGYGSTYYLDGRRVTLKDPPITRLTAEIMLEELIRTVYLPTVIKLCPNVDTPERLAALVDFTFNLGGSALKTSTLRQKVNAGLWDDVPAQLMRWVKAGGKVLRGLVLRREAECQLIS